MWLLRICSFSSSTRCSRSRRRTTYVDPSSGAEAAPDEAVAEAAAGGAPVVGTGVVVTGAGTGADDGAAVGAVVVVTAGVALDAAAGVAVLDDAVDVVAGAAAPDDDVVGAVVDFAVCPRAGSASDTAASAAKDQARIERFMFPRSLLSKPRTKSIPTGSFHRSEFAPAYLRLLARTERAILSRSSARAAGRVTPSGGWLTRSRLKQLGRLPGQCVSIMILL